MTLKSRIVVRLFGGAVLCSALALASTAHATHKTWELRESGTSCVGGSPATPGLNYSSGSVLNFGAASATVMCPVTLAGKFANTATSGAPGAFPMAEWAAAGFGRVFVYDGSPNGSVSCGANVRTATGSTYYSRSVSTSSSGMGASTLDVYGPTGGSWGGTLGVGGMSIRAFGYRCVLPPVSQIYGYRVNICQYASSGLASKCDP